MSNPQAPGERSPAEPTMEEILASIRRIIAEGKPGDSEPDALEPDIAPPVPEPKHEPRVMPASPSLERSGAAAERKVIEPDPADPALMLTRMVAEGGSVLTVAPGELGQGEVIAVEEALLLTEPLPTEAPRPATAPASASAAVPPAIPQAPRWIEPPPRAASPAAAAPPVAPARVAPSPPPPQAPPPALPEAPPPPPIRAGRTIEEVALEALEPMLRAWLDRHLREIVERRVQEEIDRISRKSES